MPNVATALKAEISRVARKELRSEIAPLRKQLSSQRSAIAALRTQMQLLQRAVKARAGGRGKPLAAASDETVPSIRFNAKGFASHRQRLGISAADMAKLLGVSQLSVYKWESGKTRPRHSQLLSIASIRSLGKEEVRGRLKQLVPPRKHAASAARRGR